MNVYNIVGTTTTNQLAILVTIFIVVLIMVEVTEKVKNLIADRKVATKTVVTKTTTAKTVTADKEVVAVVESTETTILNVYSINTNTNTIVAGYNNEYKMNIRYITMIISE